jgi:hypothetical protein
MFNFGAGPMKSTVEGTHKNSIFSETSVLKMASSSEEEDNDGPVRKGSKYRETTMADRQAIFIAVRSTMVDGKKKRGIFIEIGRQLGFKSSTISRQWRSMSQRLPALLDNHPVEEHEEIIRKNHHILFATKQSSRKKAKFKHDRVALHADIKKIRVKERRTTRHLASKLGIPLSTCHYLLKPRPPPRRIGDGDEDDGIILRRETSKLKPTLRNEHKIWRFCFAASMIETSGLPLRAQPRFKDQMDKVHIDEKWFGFAKMARSISWSKERWHHRGMSGTRTTLRR